MKKNISALIAGLIFGLGLMISGMTNPAKVIGFLDLFGQWDPSLMFVMVGAIGVSFFAFRKAMRLPASLLKEEIKLPTAQQIDLPLILGSVIFGIGWGLVGLCPGPAVASLAVGGFDIVLFVIAMLIGMEIHRLIKSR